MKIEKGYYKRNNGSNALLEVVGEHESGDVLCVWAFDKKEPFRYHPYEFKNEFEPVTQEYVDSIERQCCPARIQQGRKPEGIDLPDRWDKDQFGTRTCSYCGSVHPDDVLELIKEKGLGIQEKTTKNYKVYINAGTGRYYKFYSYHWDEGDFIDKYNVLCAELQSKKS